MTDIRNDLVDEVKKYLVGPRTEDEELPGGLSYPSDFYISGVLFPKNTELEEEDKDVLAMGSHGTDEDDATVDPDYQEGWIKQNSIGIRCSLKKDLEKVFVDIEYGKYFLTEESKWKRRRIHPAKDKGFEILLKDGDGNIDIKNNGDLESRITWKVDEGILEGRSPFRVLTVFLSNEMETPTIYDDKKKKIPFKKRKKIESERTIFQPFIKISGDDNSSPFVGISPAAENVTESEDEMLKLLLRDRLTYAQGYHCGASWEKNASPFHVQTEIVPSYTAKDISYESTNETDRPSKIDMVRLAKAKSPQEIKSQLQPLLSMYDEWIKGLTKKIETLEKTNPNLVSIAQQNQERCRETYRRMDEGLSLITDGKNSDVFDAFILAIKAMLYQRVHYEFSLGRSKGKKEPSQCPDPMVEGKHFWRPFQIAFILTSIASIENKNAGDREIVDLLWIPTGGGKTEAYLGLSAFSILLRRIRGIQDESGGTGVSVIMRYTLRLITLQQFERASSLMCALEILRRDNKEKLGDYPFLIGLWVGWSLTPNSTKMAEEALRKKANGETTVGGSPDQLIYCPWCGHQITWRNYWVDTRGDNHTNFTIVHCPNQGCDFYHPNKEDTSKALPVLTVDSDIYHRCPSLLIGTVDKFARMPWRPDSASIFGLVDRYCERHGYMTSYEDHEARHQKGRRTTVEPINRLDGPDLIIQDELHLISGPLGTMVGLYETSVEHLASRILDGRTIKPKIVASSATVRGADYQVRKLFNRSPPQKFPPPGIDQEDTFFWWENKDDGRMYVGVSYSHRSMKFALARLFASLLQRVSELRTSLGSQMDPYWTLVGYFNSIRELGGAIRLVEDDVTSNINAIVNLMDDHTNFQARTIRRPEEITGRRNAEEIREIRRILERPSDSPESLDVLLATNMISVGIDVERLGLMVITGQPKNSTEYIQVTGRIGRRKDIQGLVFTLFSPYKPRDLSHYENFTGHHRAIQKTIEPVSLTPFSERAMERALHAVLFSLIRLTIPNLSRKEHANNLRLARNRAEQLIHVILSRFREVQQVDENNQDYLNTQMILTGLLDQWEEYIDEAVREGNAQGVWFNNPFDLYGTNVNMNSKILMIDFADRESSVEHENFPLATPGSLREVEKEAGLYYL